METCKNCGRLVHDVDIMSWCDDCNYDLELRVMADAADEKED